MPSGRREILLLAVLAMAGCTTAALHKGKSPLATPQMSSDSVVLEMFSVRFPFGDSGVNEKLWAAIDEQQFTPELRERLARNGFRAGVVSGQIPVELAKLMQLNDKPPPTDEPVSTQIDELATRPPVLKRHLQIRAGRQSTILASAVYPELPVLMSEPGQLCGQTYHLAQGIFSVKSFPQADGRVRLELVPELQHDQPQQRWIGDQGVLRLEAGQPKRTFDELALSIKLSPGAMLVLSSLPNRPGSLGHHFFTEKEAEGPLEQKLLIIRLAQTQHDALFSPPQPLKLDE